MQLARLGYVQKITSGGITIVQNSGSTKYFKGLSMYNQSISIVTVSLYFIQNNSGNLGSASADNRFYRRQLQPDAHVTFTLPIPLVLDAQGDSIFIDADIYNAINVIAHGGE